MKPMKKILIPILCASLVATTFAAPVSAASLPKPAFSADSGITLVDRRGRGYGRHRGPGAVGIIGAIIAGTLIAAAVREGRARPSDMERCDEDFRDFDPRTGTYINRYGEERICPYLR